MFNDVFKQLTHRPTNSHKYSFGHVLVLGGSEGMVGAPFLAARAAMRVGAGLVTIASDKAVVEKLEKRVEEIMTLGVDTQSSQSLSLVEEYINARKVSVLIIGPGLSPVSAPLVLAMLNSINLPTIIDGGGLSIVADHMKEHQQRASSQLILTPHTGELQHFFEQELPKDRHAVIQLATQLAQSENLFIIVKGPETCTINPDGNMYENSSGGPELATAGSGDVLAGMIGGIIAQHIPPEKAAPATVYLHGLAGDLAAVEKTEPGVIASDIIEFIPKALQKSLHD